MFFIKNLKSMKGFPYIVVCKKKNRNSLSNSSGTENSIGKDIEKYTYPLSKTDMNGYVFYTIILLILPSKLRCKYCMLRKERYGNENASTQFDCICTSERN